MTREEAIHFAECLKHNWTIDFNDMEDFCDMAIEALSTDVVRCKDCRYFKKIAERSDSGLCHRDIVASAWKENGYCSRGERREP